MTPSTPSISAIHTKALRLSGILQAVAHLENESACAEGRSALIFLADEVAQELEGELDYYNTHAGRTEPKSA